MLATFQHLLPSYVPIYHLCKANLGQLQQLQGVKLALVNMYLMKCSHSTKKEPNLRALLETVSREQNQ